MKIINKTSWDAKSIKKLLTVALRRNEKIEGRLTQRNYLEVEIVYSRIKHWLPDPNKSFSGYAYIGGKYMRLRIPKKIVDPRMLARIFDHELYHIRGFRHRQMQGVGGRFLNTNNLEVDKWALEYPIIAKEVKLKPKKDLQLKRYENVLKTLKMKMSKLKRLQNQIKKWNQKKRCYEMALVVSGKIKKED